MEVSTHRAERRYEWCLIIFSITLLNGILYGLIINDYFLSDDFERLYKLQSLIENESIVTIFGYFFFTDSGGYFRPFQLLFYFIPLWFFGPNPVAYHLFSISFHIANGILVYIIAKELFSDQLASSTLRWVGMFAAFFFTVHPRQVESISYAYDLENPVAALFFFIGFLCFINYIRKSKSRDLCFYCLSWLFSLFTKEVGITLPLICGLYYFFGLLQGNQEKGTSNLSTYSACRASDHEVWSLSFAQLIETVRFLYHSPLFRRFCVFTGITVVVYFWLRYNALGVLIGGQGHTAQLEFSALRMARTLIQAHCAILIPNDLPGLKIAETYFRTHILVVLVVGVVGATAGFWKLKNIRSMFFWFCVIWVTVTFLPMINNGIGVRQITGGRYLYIPLTGYCIGLSYLIMMLKPQAKALIIGGSVCLATSIFTYRNNTAMSFAAGISEGMIRGLGELARSPRNQGVLLVVPDMYRGIYVFDNSASIPSALKLFYGNQGEALSRRLRLILRLQIENPKMYVSVQKAGDTGISLSLIGDGGFLWKPEFYSADLMDAIGLVFRDKQLINRRGDYIAHNVEINGHYEIVTPNKDDLRSANLSVVPIAQPH